MSQGEVLSQHAAQFPLRGQNGILRNDYYLYWLEVVVPALKYLNC